MFGLRPFKKFFENFIKNGIRKICFEIDENWARYFFSDNESILFVYNNEDSDKIKMITIMFKNDNE